MYSVLVLAFLMTLLLQPAAATTPVMAVCLPASPMESFIPYPDPDELLVGICDLCGISLDFCMHAIAQAPRRAPTFTADMFLEHPEWPQDQPSVLDVDESPEPDSFYTAPTPLPSVDYSDDMSFFDANIQHLNGNATSMLPETMQIHVENTYLPGDRLLAAQTARRRSPQRRQAPRPGGFPCRSCGRTFDRSCDLKRHSKTHLVRSERPHKCAVCNEGFLYPKDRARHQRTHDQLSSTQATLYCRVPGCSNVDGFSRRDNLLRHQRKQHPHLIVTA